MSGSVSITVNVLPNSFAVTGGGSFCSGGSGVAVGIDNSLSGVNYQLQINSVNSGSAVPGTGSVISFGNQSNAGTYTVIATNAYTSCINNMSGSVSITVNVLPTAFAVTGGGSFCSGGSGVAVGLANSQTEVNYQLQLNNINSGALYAGTGSALSFGNQTKDGIYTVVATNASTSCINNMNSSVTVYVNNLVSIITQPSDLTLCADASASFFVSVTGTPPINYLWYKNSVNIPGQSLSTFTIEPVSASDSGVYFCLASNICGNASSSSATLAVNIMPSASLSPLTPVQCTGTDITFYSSAIGTAPMTYTWLKNNIEIRFETTSSYTINNLSQNDVASYECVISNSCGSLTTNVSMLSVNTLPSITSQPANASQCEGTNASFSISASGTGLLNYQWTKNNIVLTGNTAQILSLNNISTSDASAYNCIVTNLCASITSSSAKLAVSTPPGITFVTPDKIKCSKDSVLFKIISSGTIPDYQWTKNGTNINGATKSYYLISVIVTTDAGTYSCLISNSCGNTSATTSLAVNSSPFIPDTISNKYICEGGSTSFSLHATGSNLSYQWTKGGSNIPGATNSTISLNNLKLSDGDIYSCVVSNTCGYKLLKPFLLIIDQKPVVNVTPVIQNKNIGDSLIYNISPGGTPPFNYQWLKDNIIISGATSNPLNIKSLTQNDGGIYYCIISNPCGSITVQIATLIINNGLGYSVKGLLIYDDKVNKPMINSTIYLVSIPEGLRLDSAKTDAAGAYTFNNVVNGTYKLVCTTTMAWGGGNPLDALFINRYYIGTYNFTDALKMLAADVDNNGKINPLDALTINRRYIGVINKFISPDWLFESKTIIVSYANVRQDIKSICSGDVDGSY